MMRVTNLTSRERRTAEILQAEERLDEARGRVTTGRRIQRPSDAPDEIAELLRLRANVAELSRRRDNAAAALPVMQAGEAALGDISGALQQVRTLALQANNATISDDQRQVLADQIERLRGRIRDLANTQVSGRYLFAGTNTDKEPFTAGPPVTYTGNGTPLEVSLTAGAPLPTSVTGEALRNPRGATDMFQALSDLAGAVRSGDTAGIAAETGGLDADLSSTVRLRADLGARIQYVQAARDQLDVDLAAARDRQSQLQDVDLAGAVLEEKSAENAQDATLAMAARLDRPSLLDYLR